MSSQRQQINRPIAVPQTKANRLTASMIPWPTRDPQRWNTTTSNSVIHRNSTLRSIEICCRNTETIWYTKRTRYQQLKIILHLHTPTNYRTRRNHGLLRSHLTLHHHPNRPSPSSRKDLLQHDHKLADELCYHLTKSWTYWTFFFEQSISNSMTSSTNKQMEQQWEVQHQPLSQKPTCKH